MGTERPSDVLIARRRGDGGNGGIDDAAASARPGCGINTTSGGGGGGNADGQRCIYGVGRTNDGKPSFVNSHNSMVLKSFGINNVCSK